MGIKWDRMEEASQGTLIEDSGEWTKGGIDCGHGGRGMGEHWGKRWDNCN